MATAKLKAPFTLRLQGSKKAIKGCQTDTIRIEKIKDKSIEVRLGRRHNKILCKKETEERIYSIAIKTTDNNY
ncbi:hypothetical protein O3M35_010761 [Rhynocoris fuscipes]|uniref:Uncharacterized protein n=1 Tax=Rhynocoris fuscipes TaxID=488301 RepID=A0AAW1D1K5_9HEMI